MCMFKSLLGFDMFVNFHVCAIILFSDMLYMLVRYASPSGPICLRCLMVTLPVPVNCYFCSVDWCNLYPVACLCTVCLLLCKEEGSSPVSAITESRDMGLYELHLFMSLLGFGMGQCLPTSICVILCC